MSNISFQGKTIFNINPAECVRLTSDPAKQTCRYLSKSNNCRIQTYMTSVFESMPEDLLVVVKNENEGFFKYVPTRGNIQKYLDYISSEVEALKSGAKNDPLTAWIIGGTDKSSSISSNIINTLNKIAERICDRPDIDTSILVGSKTGSEKFIFRPGVTQLRIDMDKNISKGSDILEELEKTFDIVELNNTQFSTIA